MKSKGLVAFRVKDNVFGSHPLFVFNCSPQEAERYFKRKYGYSYDFGEYADACAVVDKFKERTDPDDKRPGRFLWIREFKPTAEKIAELAHEVDHLVGSICLYLNLPYSFEEDEMGGNKDEIFAYMDEFYMREVLKKLL